jgi:predicted nucleic acid-binding protein
LSPRLLLLDNSAWVRLAALPEARANEIADLIVAGRIATCLPFLLESGYSARNLADRDALRARLDALPRFPLDADVERRVDDAQRQLTAIGHHRLPPVDLLVAAMADRHELDVLHYDSDYDVLAERTDLTFGSIWLAARGSLP